MSEWYTIPQLGELGMLPDVLLQAAAPNAFDLIENFKTNGNQLLIAGGHRQVSAAPDATQTTLFYTPVYPVDAPENRLIVSAGNSAIWLWDDDTPSWTDITGADPTDGYGSHWTGGWLAGNLILANRKAVRTYDPSQDSTTQPMVFNGGVDGAGDETWESRGDWAMVFRTWRQYTFAGDCTIDGVRYPSRVMWSAAVEPGQKPDDWVTRDTNDAGFVDLADTPGSVIDMIPMGEILVIYKTDAIYTCEWIGGTYVFRFRETGIPRGAAMPWGVVNAKGLHFILGVDDIYGFDGSKVQSLILGRLREWWRTDRGEHPENWYVVYDHRHEEVRFCYTTGSDYWPDSALCYNVDNGSWTLRRYAAQVHHQVLSPILDPLVPDVELYGIGADYLRIYEDSFEQDGAPIPFLLVRKALLSEPGKGWVQIDEAKIAAEGPAFTLNLGDQIAPGAAMTWRGDFTVNPATDYKVSARANGHQIGYRISGTADSKLRISHLALRVQSSGERG